MKIRKNSLIDILVKVMMAVSFVLMLGQPRITPLGIGLYLINLTVLWVTATIQTYYITEGRN